MLYKKVKVIEGEISIIGVGCWNFGGDWGSTDDKKSIDIVHKVIDLEINLFDVAPVYGWGCSEKVLGVALKKGHLRDKILTVSKGGFPWNDAHETTNNLSKESLMKEIDQTLTRLQIDHIDIYQMYWSDPDVSLEETAEALEEIKRAGEIRYVGLSNFPQADVEKMMKLTQVYCQQSLYNMLERNTTSYHGIPLDYRTEEEVLPAVRKHGQVFLPYGPLFRGPLASKFHTGITFPRNDVRNENPELVGSQLEQHFEAGEKLESLAGEYGKLMNETALNRLRQKLEVTSIIGGASSIQQLEQNIRCLTWNVDDEMVGKISEIIAPFENLQSFN